MAATGENEPLGGWAVNWIVAVWVPVSYPKNDNMN